MDDTSKAGAPNGELFVRVNSAAICSKSGLLHGAQPFLLDELLLPSRSIEQQNWPWTQKIALARRLRAQTKVRREQARARWTSVQTAINSVDTLNAHGHHMSLRSSSATSSERKTERYVGNFMRLEQLHDQFVMQSVLRFYALLEAERMYIQHWATREDAKYQDLLKQTQLLFHLNLFATQLESETLGQVRMWRLPASDSQHQRCVKAASENIKRNFFCSSSPTSSSHSHQAPSLEVMEVYKIENRPLLHHFHCFAQAMPPSEVKIKGLFCTVPSESIEHCVVWGMHLNEKSFQVATAEDIEVFNRATLGNVDGAPGTSHEFRARLKVSESKALPFPRRFSRYSTFEETRGEVLTQDNTENSGKIQYLALCRVAMGKTVRHPKKEVTSGCEEPASSFPDDPLVGTLYFADEEEYLVRYPQAVVPEFLVQVCDYNPLFLRWSHATNESAQTPPDPIIPVNLGECSIDLLSAEFENQSYDTEFTSSSLGSGLLCGGFGTAEHLTKSVLARNQQFSEEHDDDDEEEDKVELLEKRLARAARARASAAYAKLSAENVLANCARQKKLTVEDLRSLQRVFWSRSHELWADSGVGTEHAKSQCSPERQQNLQYYQQQYRHGYAMRDRQQQQNGRISAKKPAAVGSSTKAQKLLGELERGRQLETDANSNTAAATVSSKPKPRRNPNVGGRLPICNNHYSTK